MPHDELRTFDLESFFRHFPDEDAAVAFFAAQRWPEGRRCPHCRSTDTAEVRNARPMPYRCRSCRRHFSVRTGTPLAESRIPVRKWLLGSYLMAARGRTISSARLAKRLRVTPKTARFLKQRVQEAAAQARQSKHMSPSMRSLMWALRRSAGPPPDEP